jgi:hypothetical protein
MQRKIVGIFVMMLLIAFSFSSVAAIIDDEKVNKDNDKLIQQVIENGIISSDDWLEQAKILASDGAAEDDFGYSVSISGDYAIVGAWGDDDDGELSGSAYIFKRDGTSWTEQDKLLASDGAAGDYFGMSVSISGDYAIIGAYGDDDNGERSGSAYIFKRDGTSWTEQDKLLASDGAEYDFFGWSVSISGDYAIIGASGNDDEGDKSGSSYIFKRDGTSWTEQAKLLASDGAYQDLFGGSVSISGDYAIIGASYDDDEGDASGSAYIFKRDGTSWTEQAKLLASDGAEQDSFGFRVSISGDYAIIGAPCNDDKGDASGSAYIFKRDGTSWTEQAKLLASDGAEEDVFGDSVSIDGYYVIIGAKDDDDNGDASGSAYIFKRDDATWTEQAKLLASDGAAGDYFGMSVSISGDYAIIGAYANDDNGEDSGSVYIFKGPNQPPNAPTITGETNGKVGVEYEYTFNAVDPDGDDVKYFIDWDDGDPEETGFNPSGDDVKLKNTWNSKGTYTIRAYAEDTNGLVGPEGTLTVTIKKGKNRAITSPFQWFLEQHPYMFPILRLLLLRN